ncbi:hypothetical protein [Campylobacter curvus]|uniref:hypothetical protein n=1 Tax=Campylobacter curvus TaxID=200 RepID=UPI0011CC9351|nr:hypothetical protein [Campylobacter curvus]
MRIGESDYYFDGDVIRKMITSTSERYCETQLCEHNAKGHSIVLPKTARGKPKKLNFTAMQSFKGLGVYFLASPLAPSSSQISLRKRRFITRTLETTKKTRHRRQI